MLATRAPAKVNLTLEVLGRRADGYHELSSLVAFAGIGDRLSLDPAASPGLAIAGPFGAGLDAGPGNLVLKAADVFVARVPQARLGRFTLDKRLPIASGIGGGSADAAAALRLLARLNGIRLDDGAVCDAARAVGADVPVCLDSKARLMEGVGERLGPPLHLPRLAAVLVNPGVGLPTASVFTALGLPPGGPLREAAPIELGEGLPASLQRHGNDLERPALRLAPAIGETLHALGRQPGCRLARMSGSGATCFGLFDDRPAAEAAARALASAHPAWWVRATVLR